MALRSMRNLLQTIFDAKDEDSDVYGTPDNPVNNNSNEGATSSVFDPPYTPNRLDGEYNVLFYDQPLGIGLVPSTQLYGSWEVSSVKEEMDVSSNQKASPPAPKRRNQVENYDNRDIYDRSKIARGDVIIAINSSCQVANFPREDLAEYLRRCKCPIVVTLRNPAVYGTFDSRSIATAMYPTSNDYAGRPSENQKFLSRVPSAQWKRSLQYELKRNAKEAKHDEAVRKLAEALANDATIGHGGANGISDELMRRQQKMMRDKMRPKTPPTAILDNNGSAVELSSMGEYDFTFDERPIRLVLAPSTRLYGSVEVYDPKGYANDINVGDVIMAVNSDTSVSRWATDDLIDYIKELHPPVTLSFRRPVAYRKYLEKYFRSYRAPSSQSVANAMFPNSAEYKKSPVRQQKKKQVDENSSSVLLAESIMSPTSPLSPPSPLSRFPSSTLNELREFAKKINSIDQFKPWDGGSGRSELGYTSSIMTEKHVHFLWNYLPEYLTCNGMELVYTTRLHGWNLLSFYSMLEDKGPTILVIQDTHDNIFGAFCSSSWRHTTEIYGNGRSFVFTLRPQLKVYPWSGLENSFMYGRRDAVFIGGGKKGIALCLQLDEMRGFTKTCDTFNSPPLTDRSNFECEICEVWAFSGLKI